MTSESFTTPGEYQFDVPQRVVAIDIECGGSEGGRSGGEGGIVSGTLAVDPGETLNVYVGGEGEANSGGFNGGGDGGSGSTNDGNNARGGGGGGASDVRQSGSSLDDRVIVAGGGGGGGHTAREFFMPEDRGSGGSGGADVGQDGQDGEISDPSTFADGGEGATQTVGGAGGTSGRSSGQDGSFGSGGSGGSHSGFNIAMGGGGGGGGYYGAGGGAVDDSGSDAIVAAGGGGGSNYIGGVTTASTSRGGSTGDGYVELSWTPVPEDPTDLTATADGTTIALSWALSDENENEVRVYRSQESSIDVAEDSPIETLPAGTESYDDSGLLEGRQYFYVVTAANDGGESEPSNEADDTTDLPAPNAPTLTGVDSDTIGVEWQLNSSDEEDVIVELEAGKSGTFAIEAVLEPQTETYTKSNALDGQHYVARITVETEDESSTSDESEAIITDLPGVEDLTAESVEVSE